MSLLLHVCKIHNGDQLSLYTQEKLFINTDDVFLLAYLWYSTLSLLQCFGWCVLRWNKDI